MFPIRNIGLDLALQFLNFGFFFNNFENVDVKFKEDMSIICFLDFWREPSQFLKFSALEGLVSYKPVSDKK